MWEVNKVNIFMSQIKWVTATNSTIQIKGVNLLKQNGEIFILAP